MIAIERLRALEKRWRSEAWINVACDDVSRVHADELATLIAELGREAGAVAPVSFAVELADGTLGALGWIDYAKFEHVKNMGPLANGARYVFAYRTSPAHTSEARDAGAKLDEVSAYVIELANECDDLYDRALASGDQDWANAQVARLTAINQIGLKIGCIQFNDAAMRQEGGNG